MWHLNRTHLEMHPPGDDFNWLICHQNILSTHFKTSVELLDKRSALSSIAIIETAPTALYFGQFCVICWPRKHNRPHYKPFCLECGGHKVSLIIQCFWLLVQPTSLLCVCVHAQTQLTSDSAIVSAPLPLDTARKDISNTNEGMRERLSLRLCPCQPVKP